MRGHSRVAAQRRAATRRSAIARFRIVFFGVQGGTASNVHAGVVGFAASEPLGRGIVHLNLVSRGWS